MGGQAAQLRPIKARGKTGRARPAEAVQRTIRRMRRDPSLASQRPRASVAFHAMALLPTPSKVDGTGKISLRAVRISEGRDPPAADVLRHVLRRTLARRRGDETKDRLLGADVIPRWQGIGTLRPRPTRRYSVAPMPGSKVSADTMPSGD